MALRHLCGVPLFHLALAAIVCGPGTSLASAQQVPAENEARAALPGKIYVRANFERVADNGEIEKVSGTLAIDPRSGEFEELGNVGHRLRVSPDGKRFAAPRFTQTPDGRDRTDVHVIDLENFATHYIVENASLACWSGERLVYNVGDMPGNLGRRATASMVDLGTKEAHELGVPETDKVDDASADGAWLVTVSDRHPPHGRGYQLYVMHPDGSGERRLTEGPGLNCYPRFCPVANRIVYRYQRRGVGCLRIVDVDGGNLRELLRCEDGQGDAEAAAWSPDGKYLVVVRVDWTIGPDGRWKISDPAQANYRLEIITPEGTSLGQLELAGVSQIDWLGHPEWK